MRINLGKALFWVSIFGILCTIGCQVEPEDNQTTYRPDPSTEPHVWAAYGNWYREDNWFTLDADKIKCADGEEADLIFIGQKYLQLEVAACGIVQVALWQSHPPHELLDISHWDGVYRYWRAQ